MRKLALPMLLAGAVAVAACGGGGGDDGASPLDNALGYLPASAPFAVAIDTDTDGKPLSAAEQLSEELPLGAELERQLRDLIEQRGARLEELQDALGNEFVVGSTDSKSFVDSPAGEDSAFVGAIEARDGGALDKLVEGDRAEKDGEVEGAQLYRDDSGDSFAIDGDVLVVAGSKQELEAALATRAGDEGLTEDDFDTATEGTPDDALARVYFNVAELLQASPDAKDALRSKWVSALRTGGLALTADAGELKVDVNVNTDPDGLTTADLPIAAGADAPRLLDRPAEVNLALRDPAHTLAFAQATAQVVSSDFAAFETGKAQIQRRLKVDLDRDLIGQLDGDLAVSIGRNGKFGARAQLKDPAKFEQTLTKLEGVLPSFAKGFADGEIGFAKPKPGEDFYAVATEGGDQIVFGVVEDVFVISNSAAIAGTLATDRTVAVPGAEGALVISGDAGQLFRIGLDRAKGRDLGLGNRLGRAVGAGQLGNLIGSVEATTGGLTGSFTLAADR